MAEFKPMVKMYTTEPTVELKLKKGGKVEKKMQVGGLPGRAPAALPARGGMAPVAAPAAPSLMARRRAMRAMPAAPGPAAPVGMAGRLMKKGGKTKHYAEGGESRAEHKAEMKAFKDIKKELKHHESEKASKAHAGLKRGGNVGPYSKTVTHEGSHDPVNGPTGEVKEGVPGGYKRGGKAKHHHAKGGVIEETFGDYTTTKVHQAKHDPVHGTGEVAMSNAGGYKRGGRAHKHFAVGGGVTGNVSTSKPGVSHTKTGEVVEGKAAGYKKGGSAKKAYATGGAVNSAGRPVAMPKKSPSKPVRITALSGTFKKGGKVCMAEGGDPQAAREAKGYRDHYKREAEENRAMREAMNPMNWFKGIADTVRDLGGVTTTQKESSKTVTPPAKKRGGRIKK